MKSGAHVMLLLCYVWGSSALPLEGMCRFNPRQRVECGWSGITATSCKSKGCCWDDSVKSSLFCYKSDERKSDQGKVGRLAFFDEIFSPVALVNSGERSNMKTCLVEKRDRIQCGWPSISRRSCEDRGCCFEKSGRGGPWCFQADSLLINSRMRSILECTWECSRMTWRKVASAYTRCGTNDHCWMVMVGQASGTCMSACKTKQELDVYLDNITECLYLGEEEASTSKKQCDTELPCWLELYGDDALSCFKEFEENGRNYGVEIPEEELNAEEYLPEEEHPYIPHEEVIEEEDIPEEEHPGDPLKYEPRFLQLTSIEVEGAAHHVQEVQMEE